MSEAGTENAIQRITPSGSAEPSLSAVRYGIDDAYFSIRLLVR
jgi:hypothetical protein